MTMYKFKNYSEEEFVLAVKNSTSIRQVLMKLNKKESGGNYSTIKNRINELGLDCSHFTGQASNKGKKFPTRKRNIEDYLSNKYPIQSHKLRLRLLNEKYFEHKCYCCNNTKWNEQDIPLELEHIDGNNKNNNLDNLTLLCPNCHAQTDTYRGRNKKNR